MHVIPFQSDTFSIRVIDLQGEPWFVGKDIAEALGYSDTVNAIKLHCKGVVKHHPLQTNGGTQNARIINEPDLFRLIVHSQLPAAEQFERWVFEDVLPTIRKTYLRRSKISEAEFRQIIRHFALDLTATECAALTACRCAQSIPFTCASANGSALGVPNARR